MALITVARTCDAAESTYGNNEPARDAPAPMSMDKHVFRSLAGRGYDGETRAARSRIAFTATPI